MICALRFEPNMINCYQLQLSVPAIKNADSAELNTDPNESNQFLFPE